MKNLYMLVIIVSFTITANAKKIDLDQANVSSGTIPKSIQRQNALIANPESDIQDHLGKSTLEKQGTSYDKVFVSATPNSAWEWNNLHYQGTPISYAPNIGDGGVLTVIYNKYTRRPNEVTGIDEAFYDILMWVSEDNGYSWNIELLYSFKENNLSNKRRILLDITHGTTSSNKNKTVNNFDLIFAARNRVVGEYSDYDGHVLLYGLGEGEKRIIDESSVNTIANNNSPDPQKFRGDIQFVASNAENNSGIYGISLLRPVGDLSQYGYYGILGVDVTLQSPIATVPSSLWFDKFFHSESGVTSKKSSLTGATIDTDPAGNVYVGSIANNLTEDQLGTSFLPTVWKSADGSNFGEANIMPEKLLKDWIADKTADGINATSYMFLERFKGIKDMVAMVVTGEDEYSLFSIVTPIAKNLITGDNFVEEAFVLEFKYSSGVWSLHEVAEVNESENVDPDRLRPVYVIIPNLEKRLSGEGAGLFQFYARGFELEAAKTADGESILVKFLDYRLESESNKDNSHTGPLYKTAEEYNYFFYGKNENQINDTILVTTKDVLVNDIYIASRSVSDEGGWKDHNVTRDDVNYAQTHIPNIVPSLTEVPMAHSSVTRTTYPTTRPTADDNNLIDEQDYLMGLLPQAVREITNGNWIRGMSYKLFDGTQDQVVNVRNEDENLGFEIKSLSPNSANGFIDVVVESENAGYATIRAFDSMGKEVAVLFDGVLSQGVSGLPRIDLNSNNNFTTGNYYITLYKDGKSTTEILNVVK